MRLTMRFVPVRSEVTQGAATVFRVRELLIRQRTLNLYQGGALLRRIFSRWMHCQFGGGAQLHRQEQGLWKRRKQPLLLQLMPPGVELLSCYLVALRHLRHRRGLHPNRQHDPELLLVAPATTSFQPQNVTTHRRPRIRHVVNDVAIHAP